MIFIVTGASGFIGQKLVSELLKNKNNNVIGVDIHAYECDNERYSHMMLDIRKKIDIKIPKNNEKIIVFHLAALISVDESMNDPNQYYDTNVLGTINVLEFMVKNNINNIYFSSTAAVYSFGSNIFSEQDNCKPTSIYGLTKYHAENVIKFYTKRYNINAIIFRFFNVAGGRDIQLKPHHLIPVLVSNLIKCNFDNTKWYIYGEDYDTTDGTCVRDYIHVDDIVSAFTMILNHNLKYEVFNLGSGKGYTVKEIMNNLIILIKDKYSNYNVPDIIVGNRRDGDPAMLIANIDKFKDMTKWCPKKSLDNIIEDTLNSYL